MTTSQDTTRSSIATAGLAEAVPSVDKSLRDAGIDPDRLSVIQLGSKYRFPVGPPWLWQMAIGLALWLLCFFTASQIKEQFPYLLAAIELVTGLILLKSACEVLISATEQLAARFNWNHYTAGTLAEILSTLPELVVIAFIIPISPAMAFILSIITIYNNALVFSLYSYFLPKDKHGKFLMPVPISEAGTQILIGGGAMGLIMGLVMLTLSVSSESKNSITSIDLVFVSSILFSIFAVYLYKLTTSYAKEEADVRENLSMTPDDIEDRLEIVYENVQTSSYVTIVTLFFAGIMGAFIGGHAISSFAATLIGGLQINLIFTAMILAIFAGMSEYVILWQSHRKKEYGIALANAFGGITQVMFLVLPFTLIGIAFYQTFFNADHPDLPLKFSLSNIFLLLFLFPTFYTLSSLLEEDHTLGNLDTVIMTGIFLFLIVLLVTYGGNAV